MDDLVVVAQFPEVAAGLFGDRFLDRYEHGSWEHRFYSAFKLLFERRPKSWWTYVQAHKLPLVCSTARPPSADRLRLMKKHLHEIMTELGLLGFQFEANASDQ